MYLKKIRENKNCNLHNLMCLLKNDLTFKKPLKNQKLRKKDQ